MLSKKYRKNLVKPWRRSYQGKPMIVHICIEMRRGVSILLHQIPAGRDVVANSVPSPISV